MKIHILSLIQTDIRFCRLTEQLDRFGIHTDVISTNHIYPILYFMGVNDSEEVIDTYYQMVATGVDSEEELDENLSEQIFNILIQRMS